MSGNDSFTSYMVQGYKGPIIFKINSDMAMILAVIGIVSIICAIVGLLTLRAQRPNTKNFVMTFAGLIGILIPSVTVIICIVGFGNYYPTEMKLGIAPIISPLAIFVSIFAVKRRRNKVLEKLQKELEEKGLFWQAGDL